MIKKLFGQENEDIIKEIDLIIPRLGIEDLVHKGLHSIYFPEALLFVSVNNENLTSYVVKAIRDYKMA